MPPSPLFHFTLFVTGKLLLILQDSMQVHLWKASTGPVDSVPPSSLMWHPGHLFGIARTILYHHSLYLSPQLCGVPSNSSFHTQGMAWEGLSPYWLN